MMVAMEPIQLRGEMRYDEPLARHTTWRVGGPADRFYRPADSQDLMTFLRQLDSDEPLFWLGLGSNLLVRDGGFRGTVIATQGCLEDIRVEGATSLRVEAGAACAKVSRFAARKGLCGAEFLAGIPGTMGGALAMNAGAFGGETWERVIKVETIDRQGQVRTRLPAEFEVAYRSVKGPAGEWFLAAYLDLEMGDVESGQEKIRQLLSRRAETQPTGLPSCGSVFRNPADDYAARLIERAGLKNYCIGGACVSDKHANFIINTGHATASEIESLITAVQQQVFTAFGIELHTEVRVIGEGAVE